ncbi:MAG TPA: NADH-quinone oxidoreductase subunit NuoK [Candidatus Krumholzibacteria bacterium]|jgi:NADH-quinone oxidoreductase subunit K|nr:NADH-quinone oxidoreductase subunit NuoK [Candidatus Krumholzibacteria bacterium]
MESVGLTHYLVLSAFFLAAGVFTILSRRNAIVILMGVELVLNAAALNFVAFGRYVAGGLTGQLMAVFVIVIAAAEAAVALAIVLAVFRNFNTVHVDRVDRLRN